MITNANKWMSVGVVSLVAIFVAFLFFERVLAHGTGSSLEQVVDGYLVDIGYSTPALQSGEMIRFDFQLYNNDTKEAVDFSEVWVRIELDGVTQFAGGLNKPRFGSSGFSYNFPGSGQYDLFIRYSKDDERLVEHNTVLSVAEAESVDGKYMSNDKLLALLLMIVTFVLGFFTRGFYRSFRFTSDVQKHNQNSSGGYFSSYTIGLPRFKSVFSKKLFVSLAIAFLSGAAAFLVTGFVMKNWESIDQSNEPTITESQSGGGVPVVLTDQGFIPAELTIKAGTTVTFTTSEDKPFWPASNLHPSHELYAGFDPKRPLKPEEAWDFTFGKVGNWNMHDHIRSYYTGTIHVID